MLATSSNGSYVSIFCTEVVDDGVSSGCSQQLHRLGSHDGDWILLHAAYAARVRLRAVSEQRHYSTDAALAAHYAAQAACIASHCKAGGNMLHVYSQCMRFHNTSCQQLVCSPCLLQVHMQVVELVHRSIVLHQVYDVLAVTGPSTAGFHQAAFSPKHS